MYYTELVKDTKTVSDILERELGLQFSQNFTTLNLEYIGVKLNMYAEITVFKDVFEVCIKVEYSKTDKEVCIVEVESISSLLDILKHNVLNNMGK